MEKNLAKTYDPKDFEDRIYEMWETNGAFHAEVDPDKKPFTIVMPPPNITGQLHICLLYTSETLGKATGGAFHRNQKTRSRLGHRHGGSRSDR